MYPKPTDSAPMVPLARGRGPSCRIGDRARIELLDKFLVYVSRDAGGKVTTGSKPGVGGDVAKEAGVPPGSLYRWAKAGAPAWHQWVRWKEAQLFNGATPEQAFRIALGAADVVPSPTAAAPGEELEVEEELSREERLVEGIGGGLHLVDALARAEIAREEWDEWERRAGEWRGEPEDETDPETWSCVVLMRHVRRAEADCKFKCLTRVLESGSAAAVLGLMTRRWPDDYGLRAPTAQTERANPLESRTDEELDAIRTARAVDLPESEEEAGE